MFSNGSTAIDGLSGSAEGLGMSSPSASSALEDEQGPPASILKRHARIGSDDILQVLRTHILKGEIDLPADLTLCVVRDANATRLRNPLKASGDVDAVPKDIVVIDDDVTDVDADAKFDPLDLRHRSILLSHTALDLNGAAHRIYDTAELGEHAIARVLDDLATMFADLGISGPTQPLPQPDVCPFLVQAGQATISSHISRKDSCKPPLNAIVGQNGLPRSVDPSDISKHRALPLG